ncbi:MAG: deoxyribodipyrimidine photo-lyase [Sodalis sp. (in: enterobacteria)]|uniref:deoxyribodipyrimidine photo-lyase n=1 Tax=Sodalis sp. (in: enterobacteria) TaxID=1898979 RepID=UPI0039E34C3B
MTTHLLWLRNDLRLHDNTALYAACQDPPARVLAVFIATPQQWRDHDMSPRQAEFIRQHLCHLADDLAAFCQRERVDRLFYNYQYEFNERERDR